MTRSNNNPVLGDDILAKVNSIYGETKGQAIAEQLNALIQQYASIEASRESWVSERDVMLITYGDSIREPGKNPLLSLKEFLNDHCQEMLSAVHILPFYPYSSDDGFSVIDYRAVDPDLGEWKDVHGLAEHFDIMFDGVINHISQHSEWFQSYLKGEPKYAQYFIEADPNEDYSKVTRPRALPLLTEFETASGKKHLWTTFSDDQIDLNFHNEQVFIEIMDLLLFYAANGARFIRLDAIGFMWKKSGTTCMHLEETHLLIQVMRGVLDAVMPGTILITETNVPHKDNISYFGDGYNEAHMVYQFPLPPLTLHALQTGNSRKILEWADSLEPTTESTSYFNFLASHDGIGVRPVEGILSTEEVQAMADTIQAHGGFVSYRDNGDGTKSPYELNINYLDALSHPDDAEELKVKRFMAAQGILLSVIGIPGIYIHSLLGSQNDLKGVEKTGRYRSINREKLDRHIVEQQLTGDTLRSKVFQRFKQLLAVRREQPAFHPNAGQEVLMLDDRLFSIKRIAKNGEHIVVLINITNEEIEISSSSSQLGWEAGAKVHDLLSGDVIDADKAIKLAPYQVMWLKKN